MTFEFLRAVLSTEGGNGTQDRRSRIAVLCHQTDFIGDVERTDQRPAM